MLGNLCYMLGKTMLLLTNVTIMVVEMLFHSYLEMLVGIIVFVQTIMIIVPIFLTERALWKKFDKD